MDCSKEICTAETTKMLGAKVLGHPAEVAIGLISCWSTLRRARPGSGEATSMMGEGQ
jgi:hypothetical protein